MDELILDVMVNWVFEKKKSKLNYNRLVGGV